MAYLDTTGLSTLWNKIKSVFTTKDQSIPYIVGSSSDSDGVWTGSYDGIESYKDGLTIIFVPQKAGTSNGTTLNINGLGAKGCYLNNNKMTTHFSANVPILLTYVTQSGVGYWKRADYADGNTYTSAYCTTSGGTAAKTASLSNYVATPNTLTPISITNANTVKGALTLNINGRGAKPIYINGEVSSSSNYTLPAGTYLIYYDGTNYHFRTDGGFSLGGANTRVDLTEHGLIFYTIVNGELLGAAGLGLDSNGDPVFAVGNVLLDGVSGDIHGKRFIKSGGTSNEILMADGSSKSLSTISGMSISGTVNLTNGTFNTQNNSSLNSYTKVFNSMSVGEMRMYLVSDSSGNLPSTSETAVTVPYDGILSPAQVYFGKSQAFGVSVGDICVLFKKSSILNLCRIIPLNDVKPANGDFPGADGLSTVWDKTRINKIDGIEWTANHVRDNYLPKNDRFPSRPDWLIHADICLDTGVYPTCDTVTLNLGWTNQYATLVVHRTSTVDDGGYHTIEQTVYGRGADEGQIYKRIIFYNGSSTEYGDWKRIDNETSVIEVKYTLTEDEYNNHEIVNLYNIVYEISNRLYNNGWLYNDDKSYDVVVKGWVNNSYNAITYANFNVRLLTTRDGHSLGINGYVDVAQITETNEDADCPLWVGYICGKYHIENDGMTFYAPENSNFYVEI